VGKRQKLCSIQFSAFLLDSHFHDLFNGFIIFIIYDNNNDEYLHEKSIIINTSYVCNKNELIYMSSANSSIRVPQVIGRDQEDLKVDERNRRTK